MTRTRKSILEKIETYDPVDRPNVWKDARWDFPDEHHEDKITYIQSPFKAGKEYAHPIVFFVDGDHSQKGIREDWEQIERYLRTRDAVIFHDLSERPIKKFCVRLREKHPDWPWEDVPSSERGMMIIYPNL